MAHARTPRNPVHVIHVEAEVTAEVKATPMAQRVAVAARIAPFRPDVIRGNDGFAERVVAVVFVAIVPALVPSSLPVLLRLVPAAGSVISPTLVPVSPLAPLASRFFGSVYGVLKLSILHERGVIGELPLAGVRRVLGLLALVVLPSEVVVFADNLIAGSICLVVAVSLATVVATTAMLVLLHLLLFAVELLNRVLALAADVRVALGAVLEVRLVVIEHFLLFFALAVTVGLIVLRVSLTRVAIVVPKRVTREPNAVVLDAVELGSHCRISLVGCVWELLRGLVEKRVRQLLLLE